MPTTTTIPDPLPAHRVLMNDLCNQLSRLGYIETVSHAYYGDDDAHHVGGAHIAIANPLDATQAVLRKSLIPTIRRALVEAADAGENARLFEVGRVFQPGTKPVEQRQPWVLVIGTAMKPNHQEPAAWEVLGTLRSIERILAIPAGTIRPAIGTLHYKGRDLAWAELDVRMLLQARQPIRFVSTGDFPAVVRDQAVWMPVGVTFDELQTTIMKENIPLLTELTTIDAIEEAGRLGLTLRFVFRADDRSITKDEADTSMAKLKSSLERLRVTWR